MLYEIIFCFFTVLGIMQVLTLIKDLCTPKKKTPATILVNIDENSSVECIVKEYDGERIVFVCNDLSEKNIEILKKEYEFAHFVKKESLKDILTFI